MVERREEDIVKIAISAQGSTLDAQTSDVFGRAPVLLFVDTDTLACEAVNNTAIALGGGAGTAAAQLVISKGAEAILSGRLGPNAMEVFDAAGVLAYEAPLCTVREAIDLFKSGRLPRQEKPGARRSFFH